MSVCVQSAHLCAIGGGPREARAQMKMKISRAPFPERRGPQIEFSFERAHTHTKEREVQVARSHGGGGDLALI